MWNNLEKAVTFSFDDGVVQDKKLIKILNKYEMKCTFNLNSELLGKEAQITVNGRLVSQNKVEAKDVKDIYLGHEISVHTLTHPNLTGLQKNEIIRQVEEDRLNLSKLCGYDVISMAYPCGHINNDDRVAKIIKENTGVKFVRTITSSFGFNLQSNLFRFNPTIQYYNLNHVFMLAKKFLEEKFINKSLFYIWGHSYELDGYDSWEKFEELCEMLSGREDIFYGTNREVLLNE